MTDRQHPSFFALDSIVVGATAAPAILEHVDGCERCSNYVKARRLEQDPPAESPTWSPPHPDPSPQSEGAVVLPFREAETEASQAFQETIQCIIQEQRPSIAADVVVGIDFGTTNSSVAVMDYAGVVVIPNGEGRSAMPSMVAFTEDGERLVVGENAKRQAVSNSKNTIASAKRFITHRIARDLAQDNTVAGRRNMVVEADNGHQNRDLYRAGGPLEVASMILAQLKKTAESYTNKPVAEAVIAVPACFDGIQRQAIRDAGRIAGLKVRRLISEPSAVALAYGRGSLREALVAVCDLGGGKLDVSILEISGGAILVRSTCGDAGLGGDDFSRRVFDFLADQFAADNSGADVRSDEVAAQRLWEAAEVAKHELSASAETIVNVPFILADQSGPKHFNYTLTRQKLEELVEDLVQRTLELCRKALNDAHLKREQIDRVLLVGGQTRMPRIQQLVREVFDRFPVREQNADEAVAVGAAIQAGVLMGKVKDVVLLDVNPLSLGVETSGGAFTIVIPRNTPIPVKRSKVFSTARDSQSVVDVHMLQGERTMAEGNSTIGRFQLVGIPPAPRGVPQIEVVFEIDFDGIAHVSARDLETGVRHQIKTVSSSSLSHKEVERMIEVAARAKNDDAKKGELAELRSAADSLIYATEKSLEEYASMLIESDIMEIREDLEALRLAYESNDSAMLRAAVSRLETSSYEIAEAVFRGSLDEDGV